jgi:hypothetical protein
MVRDGHICWYTVSGSLYNDKYVLYIIHFEGYGSKERRIKIPLVL